MGLLELKDQELVKKTDLSRKLTLGGVTKAYPVYRIRLDQLFYNDQNDRIATWITQYRNDKENIQFSELGREEYNAIIEKFIIQSNPDAIEKTKNNIALVNQREPGVVLNDGRIIDGNRRFTCLRLIHKEDPSVFFFEAVILDATVENNQKQIKMLELAIQHGEEQRVGYNLIDLAIGAYHDIEETKLLTIEEYAQSTNENVTEVKRRLATAKLIYEFLDFMNVPLQFHIARDMQVYSVFNELVPLLRKIDNEEEVEGLKKSVFSNVMMHSFDDNRKYIRNVKALADSGFFSSYLKQQNKISQEIEEKKNNTIIRNKKDLEEFVRKNEDTAEDLQISMERVLLQNKKAQTKNRPSQIVNKSVSMLMDIDTKIIDKLSDNEKDKLKSQLGKLSAAVKLIDEEVADDTKEIDVPEPTSKKPLIASRHIEEPLVYCLDEGKTITNLAFSLRFLMHRLTDSCSNECDCLVCVLDPEYNNLCPQQSVHLIDGQATKVNFSLNSSASANKECYVVVKSVKDAFNEAQYMIKLPINIVFSVDFDF